MSLHLVLGLRSRTWDRCSRTGVSWDPLVTWVFLAVTFRVMLELLEPPAARAPLVFRVCPVREVQPAFQDPRVTE